MELLVLGDVHRPASFSNFVSRADKSAGATKTICLPRLRSMSECSSRMARLITFGWATRK